MNVKTVLYYRYLLRQTIIVDIVLVLIMAVITFLLLFTPILDRLTSIILSSIVWILPIYGFIMSFIWWYKFFNYKKQMTSNNKYLYNRITNSAIRHKVVQSRIKIKCLFTNQAQAQAFFQVIESEIEKQKKLISLKNHEK